MASGRTYEEDRTTPTYDYLQAYLDYSTYETTTTVEASWSGGIWYNWGWNNSGVYTSLGYNMGYGDVSKANSGGHSVSHGNYDKSTHDPYNGTVTQSFEKKSSSYEVYLYSYCSDDDLNGSSWDSEARYYFTVPAYNAYTIYYDANGGEGAPSAQTKIGGTNLTLSSITPTRQNYTFKGWSISPTSKIGIFQAEGTYTYNQGVTLYAVWEYNGPTPTLNSSPNRFVNLEGLSIFWNKLKSKFGPTILYDRNARTTPASTTTLSDRDVQLSESCFNYSKLVIETVFMNDFLITTTIYNPYPNYKFNIIQTQFVDNSHGGQDYATYVGFCRISTDGTILRCTDNDGTWCSPTDWTVQWIPDLSSLGVTHAINKVIGYKM